MLTYLLPWENEQDPEPNPIFVFLVIGPTTK